MNNITLRNEYGQLNIKFAKPAFSASILKKIKKINDATFICSPDVDLLDEKNNLIEYNGQPLFFENQTVSFNFIPNEVYSKNHFSLFVANKKELESEILNDTNLLSGSFRFENCVGFTDITLRDDTEQKDIIHVKTEIYPQKIDYKEDFQIMMQEITEDIYNLAFDYLEKTYLPTTPIDQPQTLSQWLIILKIVFDNFIKSIDLILKNPHYKIISTKDVKEVPRVRKVDRKVNKWILKNKKYLTKGKNKNAFKINKKFYCTHMPECRKKLSYNTFENRFVMWGVKNVLFKINETRKHLQKLNKEGVKEEDELLAYYKKKIISRVNDSLFKNIDEFNNRLHFSTVLHMSPGYKDFYHWFLLLRRGLSLSDNDIFKQDLKDIATLYEYWCFLKTIKILRENKNYNLKKNDFIKLEHERFIVKLQKGKKSKVEFNKTDTGEKIKLFYNKCFNTATYEQRPDNFIQFKKEGYQKPFWYFLDAKYRFDNVGFGYESKEVENGPPVDAIGQMHRYRDSIMKDLDRKQSYINVLKSLGGIILFPFPDNEKIFKNHRFYKSIDKVNIGAIPLQPGRKNELYNQFLDKLFDKTAEDHYENIITQDKSEYFKQSEPVMIGLVRESNFEERLHFIRNQNLYPTRFQKKYKPEERDTSKIFKVKYLALYSQKEQKIEELYRVYGFDYKSKGYLKKLGAKWNLSANEYLILSIEKVKNINLPITLQLLAGRLYTNKWIFDYAVRNKISEGNIFYINNSKLLEKYINLKKNQLKFEIKRKEYELDSNGKDISKVSIVCE